MAHGKLLQCSRYWEIAVLETKCTWRWENLISRSYACKYFDISVKKEKKSVYGSLLNALRISNELPLWKIQVQLYSRREYPISLCPISGLGNDNSGIIHTSSDQRSSARDWVWIRYVCHKIKHHKWKMNASIAPLSFMLSGYKSG